MVEFISATAFNTLAGSSGSVPAIYSCKLVCRSPSASCCASLGFDEENPYWPSHESGKPSASSSPEIVRMLVATLFASTGSNSKAVTDETLVNRPPRMGLSTMVMVARPPLVSVPTLQVTTPSANEHPPTEEFALTKETPDGSAFVTVTAVAGLAAAFETVRV